MSELLHTPTEGREPPSWGPIDDVEIYVTPQRCFEVTETPSQAPIAGNSCYRALHGLDRPCGHCPVLALGPRDQSRTRVLRTDGGFHLLRVSRTTRGTARVVRHVVESSVCRQLVTARLEGILDDAGLSLQERKVLELLTLGRTHADIARALGITARTVRFHQENLCAKLGAESRADLLRVLLY